MGWGKGQKCVAVYMAWRTSITEVQYCNLSSADDDMAVCRCAYAEASRTGLLCAVMTFSRTLAHSSMGGKRVTPSAQKLLAVFEQDG